MSSLKVVLVTGGNKGIGKALCEQILKCYSDTFVYLGSRDAQRGREAVASIIDTVKGDSSSRIEFLELDVSDQASVIVAVAKVGQTHPKGSLYGIVNNAGLGFGRDTAEVCGVNYFGAKNVTMAFLPLLNQDSGRVVNISSASGPMFVSQLPPAQQSLFTDPGVTMNMIESLIQEAIESKCYEDKYDNKTYGFSKACLNVQTRDFAELYPSLIINACTPGFILTDMTKNMGATNPPEMGTVAPLHLLFEETASGQYFGSDALRSPMDRYRSPGDPPYVPE